MQERLRRVQLEETTHCAELQAARREIEELQQKLVKVFIFFKYLNNNFKSAQNHQSAEITNLQVSLRNFQLQEELMRQDQSELRTRLENVITERNGAQNTSQTLSAVNQALAVDHEQLQGLHQALTADYEHAKNENNSLKQRLKIDKVYYKL